MYFSLWNSCNLNLIQLPWLNILAGCFCEQLTFLKSVSLDYRAEVWGRGVEVFDALRSCHQRAGSPVPALVRGMQFVQLCSATGELAPCPFTQNREEWLELSAHAVKRVGLRVSCALTCLLISLRFANGARYKDVS